MTADTGIDLSAIIEAPSDWLGRILREKGMSEAALRRGLGLKTNQVNLWLRNKNPIPPTAILEIGNILSLSDEETKYGAEIAECYKTVRDFSAHAEKISENFPHAGFVEEILLGSAYQVFRRMSRYDESGARFRLQRHIAAARSILKAIDALATEEQALLGRENAPHHLKSPMNTYVGGILDRSAESTHPRLHDLNDQILTNLRSVARYRRSDDPTDDVARQHAVHMLARHGHGADKGFIRELAGDPDIFTRRMALAGLSLSEGGDYKQVLFEEITRNQLFTQAVIVFDAIHYGDAEIKPVNLIKIPHSLRNTIHTYLSYIETSNLDAMQLDLLKLTSIATNYGKRHFDERWAVRIRNIMDRITDLDHRTDIEQMFLRVFGHLYPLI